MGIWLLIRKKKKKGFECPVHEQSDLVKYIYISTNTKYSEKIFAEGKCRTGIFTMIIENHKTTGDKLRQIMHIANDETHMPYLFCSYSR